MSVAFNKIDHDRIEKAVAEAEQNTAGEIVACLTERSDDYGLGVVRAIVMFVLLGVLLQLLITPIYSGWNLGWAYTSWGTMLTLLSFGLVGGLLAYAFPPFHRLCSGKKLMNRMVHLQAMRAFVEEEVFLTEDRTGILLFISVFERRIEVIGDEGINKQVDPSDWVEVVNRIRQGITSTDFTTGLVDAIGLCGKLLHDKGVDVKRDDRDELSNRLRIRDDDIDFEG